MPTMTDRELMRNFVADQREDAFRELVNRHLPLVHSSARRQTGNDALAEDVTQAVFILLARKAARLTGREALGGWLLKTTRFVALKAVRGEARRRQREEEAMNMNPQTASMNLQTPPDETWRLMAPQLDEAMAALGEKDRNAVVLRFHQDKSLREVGQIIGLTEEAAKKRVSRALEKLRGFFTRRGCALSTGVIGSTLATHAIGAAPAALSASTASVALAKSAAATALLPALVKKTLSAWWWAKVKWAGVVGTATTVALLSIHAISTNLEPQVSNGGAGSELRNGEIGNVAAFTRGQTGTERAAPTGLPTSPQAQQVRLIVLDDETGERLPDAAVHVRHWHNWNIDYRDDFRTDAAGVCLVPLPEHPVARLDIGAVRHGHVPRVFTWRETTRNPLPEEHTLRLERAVTVGGQVVDPLGIPLVAAEIRLQFSGGGDSDAREPHQGYFGFVNHELPVAQTDAEGRWALSLFSEKRSAFVLKVVHPEHRQLVLSGITTGQPEEWRAWQEGTAILRLLPALTLSGIVRDAAGNPLAGAKVARGASADSRQDFVLTGPNGLFTLKPLEPGPLAVLVKAEGFAPQAHTLEIQESMSFREFVLSPGRHLRLRVVNAVREPVPQARVVLEQWGTRRHILDWTAYADADGRVAWTSAPEGILHLTATAAGHAFTRELKLSADDTEHELMLQSEVKVTGTVLDDRTGRPVENFKAFHGSDFSAVSTVNWDRSSVQPGTNGSFELTYNETRFPLHVRAEAEGYHPAEMLALRQHAPTAHVELRLQKVDPAEGLRGVVLLPDGQPAVGAQVGLLSGMNQLRLSGKQLRAESAQLVRTDQTGRFSFGPDADAYLIVASHESGFVQTGLLDIDPEQLVIPLQPWAQLKGRFVRRHGPVANQGIGIVNGVGIGLQFDGNYWMKMTGSDGRFEFPLVPPGLITIVLREGARMSALLEYQTHFNALPGQVNEITFGETGITVTGRLQLAGKLSGVDWRGSGRGPGLLLIGQLVASQQPQRPASSKAIKSSNPNLWAAWATTEEGRKWYSEQDHRSAQLMAKPDGSFMASKLQPGDYKLTLMLNEEQLSESFPGQRFQVHIRRDITIPEPSTEDGTEYLDLGVIEFPLAGQTAVRE